MLSDSMTPSSGWSFESQLLNDSSCSVKPGGESASEVFFCSDWTLATCPGCCPGTLCQDLPAAIFLVCYFKPRIQKYFGRWTRCLFKAKIVFKIRWDKWREGGMEGGRKEGRKVRRRERRKEGKKERRKEGKKERKKVRHSDHSSSLI